MSGATVTSISASGATMTATLSVEPQLFADVRPGYWAKA